jgi:hypothetical protein
MPVKHKTPRFNLQVNDFASRAEVKLTGEILSMDMFSEPYSWYAPYSPYVMDRDHRKRTITLEVFLDNTFVPKESWDDEWL